MNGFFYGPHARYFSNPNPKQKIKHFIVKKNTVKEMSRDVFTNEFNDVKALVDNGILHVQNSSFPDDDADDTTDLSLPSENLARFFFCLCVCVCVCEFLGMVFFFVCLN